MPAGLSIDDFYYVLPEIVLTFGALVLLLVDLILPKRDGAIFGVAIATLLATAAAVLSFAGVNVTASAGLLAIDGFATFFKLVFILSAVMTVLMSGSYLRVEGVRAGERSWRHRLTSGSRSCSRRLAGTSALGRIVGSGAREDYPSCSEVASSDNPAD